MQTQTSFTLSASGAPFFWPNGTLESTEISLTYTPAWVQSPSAITVAVEGLGNASGDVAVLDNFSLAISETPQPRTINLNGVTFDSFRITATWTGGQNISVSVTLTSASGNGATFSAALDLATVHTA